jgi:hypothetical protein
MLGHEVRDWNSNFRKVRAIFLFAAMFRPGCAPSPGDLYWVVMKGVTSGQYGAGARGRHDVSTRETVTHDIAWQWSRLVSVFPIYLCSTHLTSTVFMDIIHPDLSLSIGPNRVGFT